jgi:hypothetical protein
MVNAIKSVLLFLLLCSTTQAQINLTYTKAKALVGITNPQQVGDRILVGADSLPSISNVVIIKATTTAKFLKLRARASLFQTVELEKIGTDEWLLTQPGKYAIEATSFDPDKGIDEKTIEVVLDGKVPTPPTPEPDPTPTPPNPPSPVPVDEFDNLGQRVAIWSSGCPKKTELAACYTKAVKQLREVPSATVNTVVAELIACRTTLLGADLPKYKTMVDNINIDLQARGAMGKAVYADYFEAISKGLL